MNYKEGHNLIEYTCISCQVVEQIYNSGDLEMPAMIPCRECKAKGYSVNADEGMMKPTGRMIHSPKHIPSSGDRVIVEYTPEIAMLYNKMKVKAIWNESISERPPISSNFDTMYDAALHLQQSYKQNTPYLITI